MQPKQIFLITLAMLATSLSFTSWAQTQKIYSFNIEAQSAGDAIVEFTLQRDLNIVYLSNLAEDKMANMVQGEYTMAEALTILLNNTGLRAHIVNNRLIQIERVTKALKSAIQQPVEQSVEKTTEYSRLPQLSEPAVLPIEQIEVVGRIISPYNLGTTLSSTKTQKDFLSTPQIINGLTNALSHDVAARNYADTALLASSVTYLERSTGVADELRLRGFAYPALKINGIGAHAYVAPVDLAFVENIEIAKGPSSVLFGRMEPGGVVNTLLKQSSAANNYVSIRHASDQFRRVDIDQSVSIGENIGGRLVGFYQQQGKEDSFNLNDAKGFMLALDHQISNGGILSFHYRFESQEVLQRFGSPLASLDSGVQFIENDEGMVEVAAPQQEDLRSGLDTQRHSINLSLSDWNINQWTANFHVQYDQYRSDSFILYPVIEEFSIELDDQVISSQDLNATLFEDPSIADRLSRAFEELSIDDEDLDFEREPFSNDTQFFSAETTFYRLNDFGQFTLEQLYGVNVNISQPDTLI